MKAIQKRWQQYNWETRMLILFGALAGLPLLTSLWPDSKVPGESTITSLDTHIPKGFVLVPIEVENFESLDSILGRFAFVDLFHAANNGGPRELVARNVRLLRAPRNPTHFAVLVPEAEARQILSHSGSYVVIVKRPGGGTEIVKNESAPKRRIIFGGQK